MRYIILFNIIFISFRASAQTVTGGVADDFSSKPLQGVTIVNTATQAQAYSDIYGGFTAQARTGDSLSFYLDGYFNTGLRIGAGITTLHIQMKPTSMQLDEFVLHNQLTKYQQDSLARRNLYAKEMNTQRIKPKFTGLGFNNLIGSVAQKFSRSYKKNKKFKQNYVKDEEQRYIDTRYTPELTGSLTGLAGDSLAAFMNTYPMEYPFARSAADIEVKMWIRDNYRTYTRQTEMKKTDNSNGIKETPLR